MAALSGHPAIKAVSPQAPVTDWWMGDDYHHHGVLMITDMLNFVAQYFGRPRPVPTQRITPMKPFFADDGNKNENALNAANADCTGDIDMLDVIAILNKTA